MTPKLDIVIPVYNEGANILATLTALRQVKTTKRVLICYDMPEDDTLTAIAKGSDAASDLDIRYVKNPARGVHRAILAGLAASEAPFVLVYPADDDYNAGMLDEMVLSAQGGNDIVCASRFMPGGSMRGCPLLK